jgi:hypothetical protein
MCKQLKLNRLDIYLEQ